MDDQLSDEQEARLKALERRKVLAPHERGELDALAHYVRDPVVHCRIEDVQRKPDDPKFPKLSPRRKESPWTRQ